MLVEYCMCVIKKTIVFNYFKLVHFYVMSMYKMKWKILYTGVYIVVCDHTAKSVLL